MKISKKCLSLEQQRIRNDLYRQIELKGLNDKYYQDLVEDYIYMLVQKDNLQKDIDKNGVRITTYNSKGFPIEKKNDSYDLLLKYNQQMLKLLDYLGIKPEEHIMEDDDDEL